MALGIVSANDAVGFWHEAAPSTSEPPQGAPQEQAHQNVTIPNSNKFKTPANGLKKLLDKAADPAKGFDGPSTQAVESWLNAHPAFTKPYFKPGYAPALKAHLGDANYAKLMHHAPTPFTDALSHYTQQPAPNSNKFKTPANGLKKLLDTNPSQDQVKGWIDAHPAFHTYLGPEYEQALKDHLGEVNHAKLKIHTQQAAPSKEEQLQKAQDDEQKQYDDWASGPNGPGGPQPPPKATTKDLSDQEKHEMSQALSGNPWGLSPSDQASQGLAPSAQPEQGVPQETPAQPVENSEHYDSTVKKLKDPNLGYPQQSQKAAESPAFHEWFHSHTLTDQAMLAKGPGMATVKFQKWLKNHPDAGQQVAPEPEFSTFTPPGVHQDDAQEADAIKQQMAPQTHETAPPPGAKTQHPALLSQIKKVFPNAHADLDNKSDDELKAQLESWLHYLPEHKGPQTFDAHVPQLQKIYDQWFGSGKGQAPAAQQEEPLSPFDQEMGVGQEAQSKIPTFEEMKEVFPKLSPEIYKNLYELGGDPDKVKANMEKSLQGAFGGAGSKAKFKALYNKYFPQQDQSKAEQSLGEQIKALKPDMLPTAEQIDEKLKNSTPAKIKTLFDNTIEQHPELADSLQKMFDQNFGKDIGGEDKPKASLGEQLNAADPGFHAQNWNNFVKSNDSEAVKDQLQKSIDYKKNSPELQKKLQDISDKYFGEKTPAAPLHLPSIVKEIAGVHGMNPNNINSGGKKLKDMGQEELAKTIKGYANNDAIADETKAKYKAIYDKYFGQGQVQLSDPNTTKSGWDDGSAKADWLKIFSGDVSTWDQNLGTPEKAAEYTKNLGLGPYKKSEINAWKAKYLGVGGDQPATDASTTFKPPTSGAKQAPYLVTPDGTLAPGVAQYIHDQYLQHVKGPPLDGLAKWTPGDWKLVNDDFHDLSDAEKKKYFDMALPDWAGGDGNVAKPEPPPEYDGAKFAEEYNAIVPGSGSSVATGQASAEKAHSKITQLINDHPGTAQSNKLIELKNKWFPAGPLSGSGGATPSPFESTPQVHALTSEDPEPEEDEGVSAPFKGEKANKSDVVNWQSAKPQDAAGWKGFANWWGKTQLSPAQESAIYHSWFPNKAVTPEQAGSWFKKVYDFHSKPGSGDLGQPDMPAWATSTWAFGSKANKEWPTFKVWANSSPGLPENLSIKQKLAIWNGLSAGDKKEIEENYVPKKPVDTKAVVTALQKAYPESDWSSWAKMPQGTLKSNVEVLAKQGYKGAIPVFNSVFGGKVAMPPEDEKEEEAPKGLPQPPQIPADKLPQWWTNNYGSTPDQVQKFSGLAHFMKLMGPAHAKAVETGDPVDTGEESDSMYSYQQAWNGTPPAIQAQIGAMNGKVPWTDLKSFKDWLATQDTPLSDIKKIKPEMFPEEGGGYNPYSYTFSGMPAAYKWLKQAKGMGQIIDKEPDPKVKAALLESYHKHFGQKPTLSQSLQSILPKPPPELKSPTWDAFLQSHSTEQINAAVKKMMKAEKDPERFVQLVDTWGKYLGGLSGIGAVTNMLGKGWSAGQPVPSKTLLQLYHWKKQGGPASSPVPDYWSIKDEDSSPYIKNKQVIGDDSGYYAPYVGWTPPVAGGSGKADPAMMGSAGEPSYTAPEKATTKAYKDLLDRVMGHQAAFSGHEKKTLASDEFQTWFNAQSTAYKKTFSANPGIALDDYKAFMEGEVTSAEPPEGEGSAKYDLNPYHWVPKATGPNQVLMNPQGLKYKVPTPSGHPKYPGWTKNPIPSMGRPHVDWPDQDLPVSEYEDPDTKQKYEIPQEELPLPGGQNFEAPKKMHELHRGIRIRLDRDRIKRDNMLKPIKNSNGNYQKDHDPLLEEISKIVHGSGDTTYPGAMDDLYNELGKHIQNKSGYIPESELKNQPWYSSGPGSSAGYDNKKIFDFGKWMMEHKPPPEQLYELAKKWGIDHPEQYGIPPPGEMPGSYTAPGLGNKLLDYLESSGYEETGSNPERYVPGFGNHWTQSTGTATSFGGGATSYNELPVMITADWNGVGEDPNRTGTGNAASGLGAVSHPGETEITLAPGAPVQVKQVRIRPHVAVPQGKPWQASKMRTMAGYLFPNESSDFRNKWAADMEKDDVGHWYSEVVPWLKKNAAWDNWVANAPKGDWIEIPVDKHMREAKKLSAYERRIEALFSDAEPDPYAKVLDEEQKDEKHWHNSPSEGWPVS